MHKFIAVTILALCADLATGNTCENDAFSLLQLNTAAIRRNVTVSGDTAVSDGSFNNARNLAFMHVPFNFGNTVETVAFFPPNTPFPAKHAYLSTLDGERFGVSENIASWEDVNRIVPRDGEVWGHLNPDLQGTLNRTGCPLYLSPQKHWPQNIAERYFGNKTVFGILRDPFERLVAQFRGGIPGYGGQSSFLSSCDVNSAIKQKMKEFLQNGDVFMEGCTYVPQAEYFDPPFGITMPVDNFLFPESMNKVFKDNGYYNMHIEVNDIMHVRMCPNSWSADLDNETRSLVKQVYARDFDLLCTHFQYCDFTEDTCINGVPQMCSNLFEWDNEKEVHCPLPTANFTHNTRINPKCHR